MKALNNLLFYGNLEKETYNSVRGRINEDNRKSITLFTLIGAVCFGIAAFFAIFSNNDVPVPLYFAGVGAFVLIFLINKLGRKKLPIISDFFAILSSIFLMTAGVLLAYTQSSERTTLLLPFFILVSLIFCYRPVYLLAILVCTEGIYLLLMHRVQSPDLFFVNAVNTLIFMFVGIAVGFYTLMIKFKKYKAEHEYQVLIERDTMTGLYNRYSCKNALAKVVELKKPVTICSLDINGLKTVNDTKGHLAGDELIIGAAHCIRDVFNPYGNIYRIGGDEFCVLIFDSFDEDDLRKALNEKTAAWKGELNDELSIALGMSRLDCDFEARLEEIIHNADLQMYDEKRKYYTYHDRRQI